MCQQDKFQWECIDRLAEYLNIPLDQNKNTNPTFIKKSLRVARAQWRSIRKQADDLRVQFLQDRAEEHASKMKMTPEKAIKAIIQAEKSRQMYQQIHSITEYKKDKKPLHRSRHTMRQWREPDQWSP
jgi:hypothetical protein